MLEIRDLNAFYGKSHVLHGVSMAVREGEIVSLLGRNGVGRSTTIKSVMGQVAAKGSIRFKGEELLGLKPFKVAHKGIGYVPEDRAIFPDLTVRQNLQLGQKSATPSTRWGEEDMYKLFPRLKERAEVLAGVISGGEQQMLTLCRTLMGDPKLIMIDEPTEGLAPMVVEQVGNFLEHLKEQGIPVLLVEQKLDIAMRISDRVYVMGHGKVVFEGTPASLREAHAVRKEWLEV